MTGFLDGDDQAHGRPVGLAVDKSGALLIADDVGNAVWRVTAAGELTLSGRPSCSALSRRSSLLAAGRNPEKAIAVLDRPAFVAGEPPKAGGWRAVRDRRRPWDSPVARDAQAPLDAACDDGLTVAKHPGYGRRKANEPDRSPGRSAI